MSSPKHLHMNKTTNQTEGEEMKEPLSHLRKEPFIRYRFQNSTFVLTMRYQHPKTIGSGAYGVVLSADNTVTNEKLAIKKISHAFESIGEGKKILREIRILKFCHHPNILSLKDLIPPKDYEHFEDMYLVNEFVDVDLNRVINSNQPLTNVHVQLFMYQLFKGVYYLHSAGIIHRDLKPSNILVTSDCSLKICDFGFARSAEVEEEGSLTEYVVTRYYRAPEVMLSSCTYSYEVDIWSCGCIMAEILSRQVLFKGDDYMNQLKLIMGTLGHVSDEDMEFITNEKGKLYIKKINNNDTINWSTKFPNITKEAADLLSHLLQFNPAKRYTAEECLNHPYFADIRERETEIKSEERYYDDNRMYNHEEIKYAFLEEILSFHPEYFEYRLDGKRAVHAANGANRE